MVKTIGLWVALATALSVRGHGEAPLPAVVPSQPGVLPSCAERMSAALTPGQMALRTAPLELKQRILATWETFHPFQTFGALASVDVMLALGEDETETRDFVREAIHAYLRRAPFRDGGMNLLPGALPLLAGPQQPERFRALLQASNSLESLPTNFTQKYELHKYGVLAEWVYAEVLPPEYALRGSLSANQTYQFSPNMGQAFQAAHLLKLEPEQKLLLTLMAIHERFDELGDAGELMGSDELIYTAGLYALSRFYFHAHHPYSYKGLWDAIALLERVHSPEMRAKVSTLFIDLSEDILSDPFQRRLIAIKQGDLGQAHSHFIHLLHTVLGGLKSSGTVEFAAWTDSVKVDYFSRSSDPALRSAIRNVLKASVTSHQISTELIIDGLLTTDDATELQRGALEAHNRGERSAAWYYAALGDIEKAAALYTEDRPFDMAERPFIADILFRVGKEKEFLAALGPSHPVNDIRAAFEARAKKRMGAQDRMKHHNFVDGKYDFFLQRFPNKTPEQWLADVEKFERQGDRHSMGLNLLMAAYSLYLRGKLD